ncbi:MAG TPA: hypothetical protein VF248_01430 [Nitrososphaeraceae archaeon]|jgi:hypothetical protein
MESGILAAIILVASIGLIGVAVSYMINTFQEVKEQNELHEGKPPIV